MPEELARVIHHYVSLIPYLSAVVIFYMIAERRYGIDISAYVWKLFLIFFAGMTVSTIVLVPFQEALNVWMKIAEGVADVLFSVLILHLWCRRHNKPPPNTV